MARRARQSFGDFARFPEYVPISARRAQAVRAAKARAKRGEKLEPVLIEGRAIATSFWGRAWCDNLERYSDFANRLPRGRTYARNGAVLDLRIAAGEVTALVQGSSLYRIRIGIRALEKNQWTSVVERCSGQIGSLVELLRGRISDEVMRVVTEPSRGLFPVPKEIELRCSCPDWASMCKHVAAALYGVGARLDTRPELLFTLRGTDAGDLVTDAAVAGGLARATERRRTLAGASLSELFGVEIEERPTEAPLRVSGTRSQRKSGDTKRGRPPEEHAVLATRAVRPSKSTAPERARKNDRLDDRIVALLEKTPGVGGLRIARALGMPFADIVQPIERLLASKRVRTTGALRATRYSAGPAAPASSVTRRRSPPRATKPPRSRKSR